MNLKNRIKRKLKDILKYITDYAKENEKVHERNAIHQSMVAIVISIATYNIFKLLYPTFETYFYAQSLPLKILPIILALLFMYGIFTIMYAVGVVTYSLSNRSHQLYIKPFIKRLIGI